VDHECGYFDRSSDDARRIKEPSVSTIAPDSGFTSRLRRSRGSLVRAAAEQFMKFPIFRLLLIAVLAAAQGKQTFTGTITDDMCAQADHSHMRMAPRTPSVPLPAS